MLGTLLTWPVIVSSLTAIGLSVACVLLHYEVLSWMHGWLPHARGPRRQRVLRLIFVVLALHSVEIFLFALGYLVLLRDPAFGSLQGIADASLVDYGYFSAVVFSTLGLGDIVPHGAIRILVGPQALLGFVLITWSASFAFIEMQRYWNDRRD
jgi:hypothetical protein